MIIPAPAPTAIPPITALDSPFEKVVGRFVPSCIEVESAPVLVAEFEQTLVACLRTTGRRLLTVVASAFHIVKVFSS